ncbi:hypothetical protein ABZ608_13135 [Streptomyces sp. NPDC013172]|uniref:hypothetical protein n=1 Tax=Streptomyces sp. NPDC013172 TaxID=3155009 RepID=UPI0033D82AAC
MEAVIAVFAVLFLLFVAGGAYITFKAVGAARRGVDRTITQARRTVEDHTLRAKSMVQIGPAAEIAQLRLTLRTSMRATQDALDAGVTEDESLKESLSLFQRLSAHGHELDGELRRLETEPDRATLATRLPELRRRAKRVTESADALRWAARDRARRFADDDLDTLSTQIGVEADALRHWTRPAPSPESPPWPEAAQGQQDRQTWPEAPRSGAAEGQAPSAITPPGPPRVFPWQKKPRPESTT